MNQVQIVKVLRKKKKPQRAIDKEQFLSQSSRQANEIARERNAKTKANRAKLHDDGR